MRKNKPGHGRFVSFDGVATAFGENEEVFCYKRQKGDHSRTNLLALKFFWTPTPPMILARLGLIKKSVLLSTAILRDGCLLISHE